jgi:hypothetical protein
MAHAAPGAERHLAVLQVECGVGEQIVVAGMVVMHVADDDVADLFGVDPDRHEAVARAAQELAPALFRHRRIEPGVEDQRPALADDRPDEIIERHGPVMRVAAIEVLARPALVMGIAHGIDFVSVGGHRALRQRCMLGARLLRFARKDNKRAAIGRVIMPD